MPSISIPSEEAMQMQSLRGLIWQGNALGACDRPGIASGYAALDAELPGRGWPPAMLTELLWLRHGAGEWRLLAPALASLTRESRTVVLVAPPHAAFAPGLMQAGVDIRRLLVVQADTATDRMWAVEQALRSSGVGALLCWLPQARPQQLRRLQLAAAASEGPVFVFRPEACKHESSPAPLRLVCAATAIDTLSVGIIKRRGPPMSAPILLRAPLPSGLRVMAVPHPSRVTEISDAVDRLVPA